ncbi:MAG: tRNA (adenosine(37)-N6)-threonylcarbamoyltransferase complex dimerization subunit type 1 TsaB [Thermodesulfobacteriota bacterium]
MKVLSLETSTPAGSAALLEDDRVLVEIALAGGLTHSRTLIPVIIRLLAEMGWVAPELDLVAVDLGPGSFTGLRIGLAAAKGLAWAGGKPLIGVSSLDVLAMALPPTARPACPLIDARHGQVYAALYRPGPNGGYERQSDYGAFSPPALADLIREETVFCGDGVRIHQTLWPELLGPLMIRASEELDFPRAGIVGRLALERLAQGHPSGPALVNPLYIRPPDLRLSPTELSTLKELI